jgi:hypothetical protein
LADRSQEHLVKSDEMIIRYRRFLLTLARELEAGREPVAPWHPEAFYKTWNEVRLEDESVDTPSLQSEAARFAAAAHEA